MKKIISLIFLMISLGIFAQNKWEIKFYNETGNGEYLIYADNDEFMPMSTKFKFILENLTSSLSDDEIVVIPPRTKRFLVATIKPINPYAPNKVEYANTYNFGNTLQENYDKDFVYSLPFESGKTHLVFQGYNGKLSHVNEFSLDFNLKTGDPIFASRTGTVVEIVNANQKNCPNISCAKFNNRIVIMHQDGTFADYSHLKYRGTAVQKGDVVEKGQLIGYSGNTGFSSGPHLHFAVFINKIDGKRTFIKTLFKTSIKDSTFLEEGQNYTKNY